MIHFVMYHCLLCPAYSQQTRDTLDAISGQQSDPARAMVDNDNDHLMTLAPIDDDDNGQWIDDEQGVDEGLMWAVREISAGMCVFKK